MKKIGKKSEFWLIISILIAALCINVVGIIFHLKNAKAYNYTANQSTFEINSTSKNAYVYAVLNSNQYFEEGYGPREVNLSYGKNDIILKINNKNNTSKTYNLIVDKHDDRSDENRLDSLSITNYDLHFNSDQTSYNLIVGCDINKVNVNATLKSTTSYFTDGYEPREVNISEGLNVVFIKVKSESGIERLYKINIFKNNSATNCNKAEGSNKLDSLSISKTNIDFKEDKYNYNLKVDNNVENLKIFAFPKDIEAKVEVNKPDTLVVGENKVNIRVTSTSGETQEYNINVTRKAKKNNKDTKLEKLEISGYNLHFDSKKKEYDITAGDKDILISAYPYSEFADVTFQETKQGNDKVLQIAVKNGDQRTIYKVVIKKEFWNSTNEIIAVLVTFIVGLIIVSILKHYEIRTKKIKRNSKITLSAVKKKTVATKVKAAVPKKTTTTKKKSTAVKRQPAKRKTTTTTKESNKTAKQSKSVKKKNK